MWDINATPKVCNLLVYNTMIYIMCIHCMQDAWTLNANCGHNAVANIWLEVCRKV